MSVFSTYFGLSFNFGDISKPRRHGKWSDIFVVRISVLYWCNGSANLQNIWSIRVQPLFENLVGSVIRGYKPAAINLSRYS